MSIQFFKQHTRSFYHWIAQTHVLVTRNHTFSFLLRDLRPGSFFNRPLSTRDASISAFSRRIKLTTIYLEARGILSLRGLIPH